MRKKRFHFVFLSGQFSTKTVDRFAVFIVTVEYAVNLVFLSDSSIIPRTKSNTQLKKDMEKCIFMYFLGTWLEHTVLLAETGYSR